MLGGKLARTECSTPRLGSKAGALLLSIVAAAPEADADGEDKDEVDWTRCGEVIPPWDWDCECSEDWIWVWAGG